MVKQMVLHILGYGKCRVFEYWEDFVAYPHFDDYYYMETVAEKVNGQMMCFDVYQNEAGQNLAIMSKYDIGGYDNE